MLSALGTSSEVRRAEREGEEVAETASVRLRSELFKLLKGKETLSQLYK